MRNNLLPSYSSTNSQSCGVPLYKRCTFTQSYRPTLSSTTTQFISCTFNSLSNSGNGGAITCLSSSSNTWMPQLIIKHSTFNSCRSSSGFGGGIYAEGLSSFSLENTMLSNCNSTEKNGGGIYFTSTVGHPFLSDSSFISCYAQNVYSSTDTADDAGGVLLYSFLSSAEPHYILQSCRFISCGCYNFGGGGYIAVKTAVLGCTDTLFSGCNCNDAEGLGLSLVTEESNFPIHFSFFSCSTRTDPPTDITLNRDAGVFSSPFLHSFSTKNPSKSVYLLFQWIVYESRNWLPHACNFLIYVKINTFEALQFLTHLSIIDHTC